MKKVMKMMVVMLVVLAMWMTMSGFTYMTEEAPNALIEALHEEGFVQSDDDENIWTYVEEGVSDNPSDYGTLYGYFDTDANIGVATISGEWTEDEVAYHYFCAVVQWDCETEDFEVLSEVQY